MKYILKKALKTFLLINLLFLYAFEGFPQSSISSEEPVTQTTPSLEGELIGEGTTYTLGKGDVVEITVRNQPDFSGQFVVGPEGNIQYMFVGDIKVEGLTKEKLKDKVVEALKKYVKIPEVSVTIAAYLSKFVYVLGEVGSPGKYPMRGDSISLREAIVVSGLPTRDAALRRVYVIKPDEIKPVYRKVDIYRLLYEGKLKDNVMLTPGDLVVVSSTVPSEINRALTNLLSPITRAAIVEDLLNGDR